MNNTLNEGLTAVPKGFADNTDILENDLVTEGIEYGEMNEADARASGYITGPVNAAVPKTTVGSFLRPLAIGFAAGVAALFLFRRRA